MDLAGSVYRWPRTALIVQEIRGLIRSGQIGPGGRIPSENELARSHSVTTDTANRALRILKDEGLVVARRGIGSQVAAEVALARAVLLPPGAVVTAFIPGPGEQKDAGAGDWEPVMAVTAPGGAVTFYPASRVILTVPG